MAGPEESAALKKKKKASGAATSKKKAADPAKKKAKKEDAAKGAKKADGEGKSSEKAAKRGAEGGGKKGKKAAKGAGADPATAGGDGAAATAAAAAASVDPAELERLRAQVVALGEDKGREEEFRCFMQVERVSRCRFVNTGTKEGREGGGGGTFCVLRCARARGRPKRAETKTGGNTTHAAAPKSTNQTKQIDRTRFCHSGTPQSAS